MIVDMLRNIFVKINITINAYNLIQIQCIIKKGYKFYEIFLYDFKYDSLTFS